MNNPMVSVCMITYNHEKYIKEAIEGVLKQIGDFDIELIIGNDCSTDRTDKIIREIIANKSARIQIKYFVQEKNLGMMPNFIFTLEHCTGRYIALCEGDDYWTDPLKLKKQVDFLEENKDFGICFHKVLIFSQQENKFYGDNITREVPPVTDIKDLARGNYIHTPSVMLRNDIKLPEWFLNCALGDWSLYVLQIKDRYIKKMDEIMAVYRIHEDGIWAKESEEYRNKLTRQTFDYVSSKADLDLSIKRILSPEIYNKYQTLSKPNFFTKLIKKISKKISKK